jgi:hypothetical protein
MFGCAFSPTLYSMEVKARKKPAIAVVYAFSHTAIPVLFSEVSFKQ